MVIFIFAIGVAHARICMGYRENCRFINLVVDLFNETNAQNDGVKMVHRALKTHMKLQY